MVNEKRYWAIYNHQIFEIFRMHKVGKMTELLNDPTTYNILGIPAYYDKIDDKIRVWPIAMEGVTVVRDL